MGIAIGIVSFRFTPVYNLKLLQLQYHSNLQQYSLSISVHYDIYLMVSFLCGLCLKYCRESLSDIAIKSVNLRKYFQVTCKSEQDSG